MRTRIFLALALILIMSNVSSQTFPYAVYNSAAGNQNIRDGACVSGTNIITSLAPNLKLVASTSQNSCSYLWYRVDLPSALQSGNLFGWSCGGSPGGCDMMPASNTGYVEVYGTGSAGLFVRTSAGSGNVTIGASNAKVWDTQCFATTGTTQIYMSVLWYQIYLPNNCSQTTGWCSGDYLNFYGPTPCTFSISPTSNSVASSSSTGSVSVTTQVGCVWTASSNNSWINITSGSSGSGNGTVNYSVNSNSSSSPRTGTLTIAGQTFTINQAGLNCFYTISPTSNSVNSNATSGSVSVTTQTGCAWTASSNNSWITITSGSAGTGNGTVNYSVTANTSTNSRVGTLTIQGNTFTVNQAGVNCTYTISPTSNSVSSSSTTGSISVNTQSGCSWIATSNDSWISITSGSTGTGNGTVNYSVNSNTSSNNRIGSITVAGITFTINQSGAAASNPDLTIQSPTTNINTLTPLSSTQVSYTIQNTSSAVATNSITSFFLSTDAVYNSGFDTWVQDDSVPSIAASASLLRTVTITIPNSTPAGVWYILMIADAPAAITESNENNNLSFTSISVASSLSCSNDYPFGAPSAPCPWVIDPWSFYKWQCTSYVGWKVNQFHGDIDTTSGGHAFYNCLNGGNLSISGNSSLCNTTNPAYCLSDACHWDDVLVQMNFAVNSTPAVGSIAHWNSGVNGAGSAGHVAFVNSVSGNTICITEYNWIPCSFSSRIIDITSDPNRPEQFIHIEAGGLGGVGQNEHVSVSSSINLYPNPNHGSFTLNYQAEEGEWTSVSVFDLLGQLVHTEMVLSNAGENSKEIEIPQLAPGVYLVQLLVGDKIYNDRIIVDE